MIKLRIAVLAFVIGAACLGTALAGGGYCAMAYSTSTGNWGDGRGYNTRAEAEARAMGECHARDAFIAGWGHNRYVVLVVGNGGTAWGCGSQPTYEAAKREAFRLCPAADGHVLRYVYSFD